VALDDDEELDGVGVRFNEDFASLYLSQSSVHGQTRLLRRCQRGKHALV